MSAVVSKRKSSKRPTGRPSTYRKEYDQRVLALAAQGYSLTQISAELDIPRTTLLRWGDMYSGFRTTITRAKELERAWWERQGMEALKMGSDFNAAVWKKSMEARFKDKYTQRREFSGPKGKPIEIVSKAADLITDLDAAE